MREEYGDCFIENELGLPNVLAQIYQKDDREEKGFIFIIDEWDCLFREAKNNKEIQKKYLDFLKLLLKDRSYVSLAYMTGILPIKKYGTHSAINIFKEFSMMNPVELAEFVGFTESEVRQLCRQYDMDFTQIKNWYDGYQFENQINIYNPKSVVDAMMTGDIDSYWTETETYEALKVYKLKWDKTAETAMKQIKEKRYVQALEEYIGEILLVGINYDKKSKTHQCMIEYYKK